VTGTGPVADPGNAGNSAPARASNLLLRVISAAVLAPLAIAAAYFGGWPFALFWGAAGIAVLWEWIGIVGGGGDRNRLVFSSSAGATALAAVLGARDRPISAVLIVALGALATAIFARRDRRLWIVSGIGYAAVMVLAPIVLRHDASYGFAALIFLFAIVWSTDALGYFGGRAIGGPKLALAISPNKTWSGAIAGALGATLIAAIGARVAGPFNVGAIAAVALLLSVAAQAGDLLESSIKRRFGIKDASHLIPGHGGVMDRLDGFWAAALAACLIGLARGGLESAARGLLIW
jgi:phosphatidate cytidylyltransferase